MTTVRPIAPAMPRAFARRTLLLLAAATAAGCATPVPPQVRRREEVPPPGPGMAKLCLLRGHADVGKDAWPFVTLNGNRIAPLPAGTSTFLDVRPGNWRIGVEPAEGMGAQWRAATVVEAQAGRTYFLELVLAAELRGGSVGFIGAIPVYTPTHYRGTGDAWRMVDEAEGRELARRYPFTEPLVEELR